MQKQYLYFFILLNPAKSAGAIHTGQIKYAFSETVISAPAYSYPGEQLSISEITQKFFLNMLLLKLTIKLGSNGRAVGIFNTP